MTRGTNSQLSGGKLAYVNNLNSDMCCNQGGSRQRTKHQFCLRVGREEGKLQKSCKVLKENKSLFSEQKEHSR